VRYAFIRGQVGRYPVRVMCRVLEVSEQGYYAWCSRPESRRLCENRELMDRVRVVFGEHRQRYGSPRVHKELVAQGRCCGRHRVARLMSQDGLRAKAARKFRVTTDSSHGKAPAVNVLDREFNPAAANRVWAGDITYLWTDEGWMYLAVFIDLYSRMVVGWALSKRLTVDLVLLAFERAIARRRPGAGLLVHTDRGSQYVATNFLQRLSDRQITLSMSRKGNCWDNAVVESFFHSLKVELVHGERFCSRWQLEREVFEYIELYFNRKRRHSTLDYLSPQEYETLNCKEARIAA
jgi:putative transposase